ncbi:MAG: hypothetical protein QW052_06270 [Candidatus Nitrosocaldaceae archaeon]
MWTRIKNLFVEGKAYIKGKVVVDSISARRYDNLPISVGKDIGCHVTRDSNFSVMPDNCVPVPFNVIRYDTDEMFDIENGRIVIKTKGKYIIGVNIGWAYNPNGIRILSIKRISEIKGTSYVARSYSSPYVSGTAYGITQFICVDVDCDVGEIYFVDVYQNSGSFLTIGKEDEFYPEFWARKVG